ncbi:MAG TPA: hypothetical protein VEZ70_01455 [Allosphingosinicella sp.]|nr:hypothetical protein [Allosphingosinicella sp.]
MDAGRREELKRRQALMQLRNRRHEVSRDFRAIAPHLCARGIRFAKLMPIACKRALGDLASGPGQDEQLDIASLPNGRTGGWETDEERASLLRAALDACCAPDTAVAVVISPFCAGIRMRAADAAEHEAILWAHCWRLLWIVAAQGDRWLIQVGGSSGVFEPSVSYALDMGGSDRIADETALG